MKLTSVYKFLSMLGMFIAVTAVAIPVPVPGDLSPDGTRVTRYVKRKKY